MKIEPGDQIIVHPDAIGGLDDVDCRTQVVVDVVGDEAKVTALCDCGVDDMWVKLWHLEVKD